jgi:NADP-dependent 3-hydroxy acid dehydrogenase YdfG
MASIPKRNVLIIGASGIVGKSAVEQYIDDGNWNVHGLSRRFPEILDEKHAKEFRHTKLDLMDVEECQRTLPQFSHVTHILYSALIEQDGDLQGMGHSILQRQGEVANIHRRLMEVY